MKNKEISYLLEEQPFVEIVALIQAACQKAVQSVNQPLRALYWNVKQHISPKLTRAEWADGFILQKFSPLVRRFKQTLNAYFTEPCMIPVRSTRYHGRT